MARFEPVSLSPVAVMPREVPIPFGLSWKELRAAMPGFDASSGDPRMLMTYEKQGLHKGETSLNAAERSSFVYVR